MKFNEHFYLRVRLEKKEGSYLSTTLLAGEKTTLRKNKICHNFTHLFPMKFFLRKTFQKKTTASFNHLLNVPKLLNFPKPIIRPVEQKKSVEL